MEEVINSNAQLNDNQMDDNSDDNSLEFLTFVINHEHYALDIKMVNEIKCWVKPTRLPNAPHFVIGVLNLRGLIVPIFDLKAKFGMTHTEINDKSVVIFLTHENRTIGIIVDSVSDIIKISEETIKPTPQMEGELRQEFLSGLLNLQDRMVVILDMDQLLKQLDLTMHKKVVQ